MTIHRGRLTEILGTVTDTQEVFYRGWPERYPGHRAIGYFCTYVPEEIIHAAGYVPVRIRSSRQIPSYADAHLQSYTCALCRSALDQALRGYLSFLKGVIFAHTCDTLQALADIWRMSFPDLYVETIVQPVNLSSPSTRPYLIAELQRFRRSLEEFTGQAISDEAISASSELYNNKRRLLAQLYELRDRLSAPELYATINAGFTMPPERYNQLLGELIGHLSAKEETPRKGRGLILVGAVLDDLAILSLIEELGAQIVADDLCTGSRYFAQLVEVSGDPIAALADRYLHRLPCPAKHHPDHHPGQHLLKLVGETKADGAIFVLQKFCDPHAFDYAIVKGKLEAAAVPYLRLEIEHIPALEQWRTRLEAFLEMIK